jgi:flagellar biosynthesis protein FlhB
VSADKTEKPTPKKLKQARREGQIGRTPDLGAWAGILIASVLLPMALRAGMHAATDMLGQVRAVIERPDQSTLLGMVRDGVFAAAKAVAPLAACLMVLGIAATATQGGLYPATSLLKPKFKRLNPWPGVKRMFGPQAMWETVKAVVKTGVLGLVLWYSVRNLMPLLAGAGQLPLSSTLNMIADAALTLIRSAALAGLVMAAADYAVVRRRTQKQLRMTKQEVKEEYKQAEGDPHLRAAIRSKQIAMSRNRMMADLAKADVVVVNPTHVAVALRYDPAKGAPRVVAKGAGAIAAKIRAVATDKRIPMVSDVPLARALYKTCEIGQEIPPEMYGAVAKVLAFVLTLKRRGSAAGLHRTAASAMAG